MLVRKGFRYRLYPTPVQEQRLLEWDNALRFLWNLALEQRWLGLRRTSNGRKLYSAFDQIRELTELRRALKWLDAVPRNACTQLLIELDRAWQRRAAGVQRPPRMKRKGVDSLSVTEPHPKKFRLSGDVLHFPKLGGVRAVVHRPLEGTPKLCTISRDGDQWFASIVVENDIPEPQPRFAPSVALLRRPGLIVADSDRNAIEVPRYHERSLKRLRRIEATIVRRKKGSKNRHKAVQRARRLHRRIRRQREHLNHVLSATYAQSHGTVIVEKRSEGTSAARAHDGYGQLSAMLRYKLIRSGGCLVEFEAVDSGACESAGTIASAVSDAVKLFHRASRSVLPVEGSPMAPQRSRKRLRVARRSSEGRG